MGFLLITTLQSSAGCNKRIKPVGTKLPELTGAERGRYNSAIL